MDEAILRQEEDNRLRTLAEEFAARRALLRERQALSAERERLEARYKEQAHALPSQAEMPGGWHELEHVDPDADEQLDREEELRRAATSEEFGVRRALLAEKQRIAADRKALEEQRASFEARLRQQRSEEWAVEMESVASGPEQPHADAIDLGAVGASAGGAACEPDYDLTPARQLVVQSCPCSPIRGGLADADMFQTPPRRSQHSVPQDGMTPTSLPLPEQQYQWQFDGTPSPVAARAPQKGEGAKSEAPPAYPPDAAPNAAPKRHDDGAVQAPAPMLWGWPPPKPQLEQVCHTAPSYGHCWPGVPKQDLLPWLPGSAAMVLPYQTGGAAMDALAEAVGIPPPYQQQGFAIPQYFHHPGPEWVQPAPQASSSSFQFNITLRKADNSEFGFFVSSTAPEGPLIVTEILKGGAVEAWNKQCTGPQAWRVVQKGDHIMKINDTHDVKDMLSEIHARQLLRLTILRWEQ